jgi:Holliday junction resolvasome RuvABC endonuclease subunit
MALGLDAATTTGWAVVEHVGRLRVVEFGKIKIRHHQRLAEVLTRAVHLGVQVAAIEVPYVDKNVDTAIKLGMICGRWQQELDRVGMPYTTHKASEWQHQMLAGLITRRSPREDRKKAAAIWVASTFNLRVGEDEADAIILASWRAKLGAYAARVGVLE